jgi:hypothetical protein
MPKPGSARGYAANAFVTPLVLMLTGGGRSLEDLRTLKNDTALNQVLKQDVLPSTDAMGDWLRRTGTRTGLDGLGRINRRAVATRIRQIGIQAHTLDGDASQIVAEKEAAHVTYKGEQGDMPMIGHLSARTASTSAAISSSLIGAAPAASSAGAMASRRSSALRFLTLVARNSTKSSTSATCCGESVLIFDIKLCSTVAFITILPAAARSARQRLKRTGRHKPLLDHILVLVGRLLTLLELFRARRSRLHCLSL